MSKELITTNTAAVARLDELASQAGELAKYDSPFTKAIATANCIQELRVALQAPGVMDAIMSLQGTAIGFKADKAYPASVVADALIVSVIRGLPAVGNCWNIIAGNCYVTKEGMQLLLRRMKGLTYQLVPGIPKMSGDKGAICPMKLSWSYNGQQGTQNLDLCIRVNSSMGTDAIIGKATRKACAWLYGYLTGSEMPDGEADDADAIPVAAKVEKQASGTSRLENRLNANPLEQKILLKKDDQDCTGEPDEATLFAMEASSQQPSAGHAE